MMKCSGEFRDLTKFSRTERVNVNGRGFGVLTMNMEKTVCKEVRQAIAIIITKAVLMVVILEL